MACRERVRDVSYLEEKWNRADGLAGDADLKIVNEIKPRNERHKNDQPKGFRRTENLTHHG
jgi:hypothetical protein